MKATLERQSAMKYLPLLCESLRERADTNEFAPKSSPSLSTSTNGKVATSDDSLLFARRQDVVNF